MTAILDRRRFLQSTVAGAAGLTLGAGSLGRAYAATDLTIGVIYVGARDDFGWNQAHAVAVQTLKSVPGVKVVEEENVPETDAVSKTMESMINLDGATLLLPTSFGYYNPFVVDEAKSHGDVQFRHAAPLWTDKDPKNAGSYFAFLDQGHYVDGVAAGAASKSGKLGFVAAKPIGIVLRNINSFLLGARTVNPNATVQVIFTGDWSLPVREAEATNALVDAGCDLITCHGRRPQSRDPDRRVAWSEDMRAQCFPGPPCAEGLRHRRRIQVGHHLHRFRWSAQQGAAAAEHHLRRV